jgi:hypothetical protein
MAQLIDRQMFLDEAALRVVGALAVSRYTAKDIAQMSYNYAEALWEERERRRAVVSEEPQQATTSTGPDL